MAGLLGRMLQKGAAGAAGAAGQALQAEHQNKLEMQRMEKFEQVKADILAKKEEKLKQLAGSPWGSPVRVQRDGKTFLSGMTYNDQTGQASLSEVEIPGELVSTMGETAGQQTQRKIEEEVGKKSGELDVRLEKEPELEREKKKAATIGKAEGEAAFSLPETIQTAQYSMDLIDKAINHPGLETATGASSRADPRNFIPGTEAYNFNVLMDQIQGRTFLAAFESLKGGGQITEIEGQKAEQSIARLNKAQSTEEFVSSLTELQGIIGSGIERAKKKAGGNGSGAAAAPKTGGQIMVDANGNRAMVYPDGSYEEM